MALTTNQENVKHSVLHAIDVKAKIILPTCASPKAQILTTKSFTRSGNNRTPKQAKISSVLGELESSQKDKNELFTNLNVNDENIRFKMDTGAQCNVIPEHAFEKLRKKPSLQTTKVTLTAYGGVRYASL